jgi:hypothetical protein
LAFLGLAAFGFTAFFGLAASFFLGLTTSPILNFKGYPNSLKRI